MGGLFSSSSKRLVKQDEISAVLGSGAAGSEGGKLDHLKTVFNEVKRADSMSHAMFRRTLFPQNAPLRLTRALYDIYATMHSSKEMNLEDFLEVYYLLAVEGQEARSKSQKQGEQQLVQQKDPQGRESQDRRADLIFYIIQNIGEINEQAGSQKKKKAKKQKRDEQNEVPIENIFTLGVTILHLEQEEVYKLLIQSQISPESPISLHNFRPFFRNNIDTPLFSWIQPLACDYKGTQNAQSQAEAKLGEKGSQMAQSMTVSRLIRQETGVGAIEDPTQLFSEDELKCLSAFFNEKLVKKHDLKSSFASLDNLLADFWLPPLLQRKITESFLYASETNYYEWKSFLKVMSSLTKLSDNEDQLYAFIFDIFTKYSNKSMTKDQLISCFETLSGPIIDQDPNLIDYVDNMRDGIQKDVFVGLAKDISLQKHHFEHLSTLFEVELRADRKRRSPEEELFVVRIAMDGELNYKDYFKRKLSKPQQNQSFYLLNKKFWQNWLSYAAGPSYSMFYDPQETEPLQSSSEAVQGQSQLNTPGGEKIRRPFSIQNDVLRGIGVSSNFNLKFGICFGKDFIVVPPRVFKAFTIWYGNSFEICRSIITYDQEKIAHRNTVLLQSVVAENSKQKQIKDLQIDEASALRNMDLLTHIDREKDMVYELELHPLVISCGRIKDDGKVPTVTRTGQFSRKTKLLELQIKLVEAFQNVQNDEIGRKTRIWKNTDGFINLDQKQESITLEEIGFKAGDKVYIEFLLENQQWPSDKSEDEAFVKRAEKVRTKGCANLGNTCYMNSSMQCIANTPFFRDFFVQESDERGELLADEKLNESKKEIKENQAKKEDNALWKYQVNPENVMGQKGEFVAPFASTMAKIWDSGALFSVYPWQFKTALGKLNNDFQGFRQHDAQEFLVFLLENLHEELNIRMNKPYIQNPEDRKDTVQLSQEFWCNYLRRNWSFICLLFHGQIKSTIECPVCNHKKVMYEPYSILSLPVPNSNNLLLGIQVNTLPSQISNILLQGAKKLQSQIVPNFDPHLLKRPSTSIIDKEEEFKVKQQRERSIYVNVSIDQGETVQELFKRVKEMQGIDLIGKIDIEDGSQVELTKLLLYVYKDAKKSAVTLLLEEEFTLEEIGVIDRQSLIITEVLTEDAIRIIDDFYENEGPNRDQEILEETIQSDVKVDNNNALMRTNKPKFKLQEVEFERKKDGQSQDGTQFEEQNQLQLTNPGDGEQVQIIDTSISNKTSKSRKTGKFSTNRYFNLFYKYKQTPCEIIALKPPTEIALMIFNRFLTLRNKAEQLIKEHEPIFMEFQFPVLASKCTTAREIYELVWMRVRSFLKLEAHSRSNLWWDKIQSSDKKSADILSPFVLKFVDISGKSCSLCMWDQRCYGCILDPKTHQESNFWPLLQQNTYLACEWDQKFFKKFYDRQNALPQDHVSISQINDELNKPIKLQECFQLFSKEDQISINCNNCYQQVEKSIKNLKIQKVPPILTIHLMRFKVTTTQILKMQSLIQYPLYDLDLEPYISFPEKNMCYKYDLYGVVNHFGTLNGGHYTSYVKNMLSGEWLCYNDSSVSGISEGEVVSKSAYILFYRRKDVKGQSLSSVLPRLNERQPKDNFPGRPLRLKTGQVGYLIEYREGHACPYVIGLDSDIKFCVPPDWIVDDPDSEDLSAVNKLIKSDNDKDQNGKKQKNSGCTLF